MPMAVGMRKPESTTLPPTRVGLVGAGKVALTHARVLRATPGVALSAVTDIDRKKANALAARFGIPAAFGGLPEMLRAGGLDAVHILTPPPDHCRTAVECMAAGCHVLIEKPMAVSSEEAGRIRSAAGRYGVTVAVNHPVIHFAPFLRMLEVMRSRRLGRIDAVLATASSQLPLGATGLWMLREPGNIILELGVHHLSRLLLLSGPVRSCATQVSGKVILNNGKPFYREWFATLLCEVAPLQLHLSFGGDFGDASVTVLGQDGAITADFRRGTLKIHENSRFMEPAAAMLDSFRNGARMMRDGLRTFTGFTAASLNLRPWGDEYTRMMSCSIGDFHRAVREKRPPVSGLEEGCAAVRACEAIIEASGVQDYARQENAYV